MHLDPSNIADDLVVMAVGGGFAWLCKLRRDIDGAFKKIRCLEYQLKELDDGRYCDQTDAGDRE